MLNSERKIFDGSAIIASPTQFNLLVPEVSERTKRPNSFGVWFGNSNRDYVKDQKYILL